MRLTTVIAKLEPGGAQLGALRKLVALREHGIESNVIAAEATAPGIGLFTTQGIGVEVWGGCSGMQYACRSDFSDWLRPRLARADLVHAHMLGAWWAAARAIPHGVPLVGSEHNAFQWPGRPRRSEMREAVRRIDLFYAHSAAARHEVAAAGLDRARIRHGLSPVPFAGELVPRTTDTGSRRVVFAGRLHREKGPDVLLEALGLMERPPSAFLLGAGPEEDALRRRAAELGLARVHFAGWQDEPVAWLAGAAACVVPSRHDAWPQSAVLAMGMRVPVIASGVEGVPLVLARGRGVTVPPDDPAALAEAIDAVLDGRVRPDLDAAQAYAAAHSTDRVARIYAEDYAELVERPPMAQPLAA